MKKLYAILCAAMAVSGFSAAQAQQLPNVGVEEAQTLADSNTKNYTGLLTVNMFDSDIVKDQKAEIQITPTGENTCDFLLPNFAIDLGDGPQTLGDIAVNNVTMTKTDNGTAYAGKVEHMKLLEGFIDADVDLTGTITNDGAVDMKIDVMWNNEGAQIPIFVTFKAEAGAGVSDITVDNNAPAEYFNLNGVRVANPAAGNLYIKHQGNKTVKVLVK